MTKWIVIEGGEGTGKSTLINSLYKTLTDTGLRVLLTKEPGSPHCPVTMELRNIMLNNDYESEMTVIGRELISQAIRSIHVAYVRKAMHEYDVVLQDRGILSGYSYGKACSVGKGTLEHMAQQVTGFNYGIAGIIDKLYDYTIFLECDPEIGLVRAGRAKKEFTNGDAMELKGLEFHNEVRDNFNEMFNWVIEMGSENGCRINVENKKRDEVFDIALEKVLSVLRDEDV